MDRYIVRVNGEQQVGCRATGACSVMASTAVVFLSKPRGQSVVTSNKEGLSAPAIVIKGDGQTLAPTTTEAQDKVTQGQRRINLIWGSVQGLIAVIITGATVTVLAMTAVSTREITTGQLTVISHLVVMTTLILSFYFARNDSASKGSGAKPTEPHEGR